MSQASSRKSSSNDEKFCPTSSGDSSDVFLSPSDCLKGLTNVDLMNIAENGEVFQQFVRSMSGGDYGSQSPSSTRAASAGTPVSGRRASNGAIPKRDYLSPNSPRVPIPRRNSSSSTANFLRHVSHEGDGERNLRLYLQDFSRSGEDGRRLFRRRLMKEEDDRKQKSDLQRRSLETAFAEDKTLGLNFRGSQPKDLDDDVDGSQSQLCRCRSDSDVDVADVKTTLKTDADKKSKLSTIFAAVNKTFRRKRCPCFPKPVEGETPEAYCQRMDALAEVTVARSRGKWRRAWTCIRRLLASAKDSLVRATRYLLCCCFTGTAK